MRWARRQATCCPPASSCPAAQPRPSCCAPLSTCAPAPPPWRPRCGAPGRPDRQQLSSAPRSGMISSMIGRMHHVVLDCPDPAALAAFYSALLGLPVSYRDDDWIVVAASDTSSGLAFQRASGNQPPTWPDPAVPQQFHLDIMVEDVD